MTAEPAARANGIHVVDGLSVTIAGRVDPEAPTILFVAGLGGVGATWARLVAALAPEFRLITYDQRGTGASDAATRLPPGHHVRDMADDAARLIDALGIGRCHVVGHALGGLVTLQLALDRPALIDRAVLTNAWARIDPHTERCLDMRLMLLDAGGAEAWLRAQPIFLFPAAWLSENHGIAEIRQAHAPALSLDNLRARVAALRSFDIEPRLGEIGHRVLWLATRDDVLVPFTRSSHAASAMKRAQLAIMPNGGHAVHVTETKDVENILLDFFQSPD